MDILAGLRPRRPPTPPAPLDTSFPSSMHGDITCRKFWYKAWYLRTDGSVKPMRGELDEVCSIWMQTHPPEISTNFSSFLRSIQIDYEPLAKFDWNVLSLRIDPEDENTMIAYSEALDTTEHGASMEKPIHVLAPLMLLGFNNRVRRAPSGWEPIIAE